jgi:hypothetical protein
VSTLSLLARDVILTPVLLFILQLLTNLTNCVSNLVLN